MMASSEGPPMERRGSRWSRRQFVLGVAGLGLVPLLNLDEIVPLPEGGIATSMEKLQT
jgi:hypothetical protein